MSTEKTATTLDADRAEPTSRTGRLMRDLRRTPLFRQLVPMEAGIGWPIPVRRDGGEGGRAPVYMKLPLFGYRPSPEQGGGARLYPPFATVTLDWETGRPVAYTDLRYTRPWPVEEHPEPVGTFPHDAVRGSAGAYVADRARLLGMYDALFERLASLEPFEDRWTAEFSELLGRLLEPSLETYYRCLGAKFFDRFLGPAGDQDG